MFLVASDVVKEVNIVQTLGEPLFDCPVEYAMLFVVCVVESSFCPPEEATSSSLRIYNYLS